MNTTPSTASTKSSLFLSFGASLMGWFAVFNWLDDFAFFRVMAFQLRRVDVSAPVLNAGAYAALYGACLLSIVVLVGNARRVVRFLGYLGVLVGICVHLGFEAVNGAGFSYHDAALIWTETGFIGDALQFFAADWLPPTLASIAAVACYELFLARRLAFVRSWLWCLLPLLIVPAHVSFLEHTFCKVYETPMPYRVPMLFDYARRFRAPYIGPREEPELFPVAAPMADHIVVIVDESIRGDLLGLNGGPAATTVQLEGQASLFNYGVASSPSNASATTQIILQSGLQPNQVPDLERLSLKGPNVFAYLARAGFSVFLVNSQHYSDQPTNFMSRFDLDALDGKHVIRMESEGREEWEADRLGLERVTELIASHEQSFIYVVKAGAHFPYAGKYPPDRSAIPPTDGEPANGRRLHYLKALEWVVGDYLADLSAGFEATGKRVLVVYTADHGQTLERREGIKGIQPHAVLENPGFEQAAVPLMLFAIGPGTAERVSQSFHPSLRDRVSAFEVFPTILVAAGFAPEVVRARYGPSLFDDGARPPRVFVSGNLFADPHAYEAEWIREGGEQVYLNPFAPPPSTSAR